VATTRASARNLPILWQLRISHYNEKVRWALDYKRIPHLRRSLLPGPHSRKAKALTGDCVTTPVLTLDGRSIGDSTRIIAALEDRWPKPPLYPRDEAERRRALELEDFFDEELGPHIRRATYQELIDHPDKLVPLMADGQPWLVQKLVRGTFPALRAGMRRTLEITPAAAAASRQKTVAAIDRLEDEIGPSGYLVGDRFTVADLTVAALLYPVARPPEFPYPLIADPPASALEFLDPLAERPGGQWVAEMYRRHRNVSPEPASARVLVGG
jgi:glutathione S-transferase